MGNEDAGAGTSGAAFAQQPQAAPTPMHSQPAGPIPMHSQAAQVPIYEAAPGGTPGLQPGGPVGYPPPQQPGYGPPPPMGYAAAGVPPHGHGGVVQGRPPLVSIISPEDAKKIRKMQWINFGCTMLQLTCSLAVILIVRNSLTSITVGSQTSSGRAWDFQCYAATQLWPGTCEYAYSLASISVFIGFILSLMQCLTMDCCGAGRAIEAGFDAAACAWWVAGGVTLGIRASEANAAGVPERAARNAVVALCWVSAVTFGALFVTNMVLIKRLGRAYKAAAQQLQQHMTAYPMGPGAVQMAPMAGGAPAGYPQQPMMAAPQQQAAPPGPPAGYPTAWTPPPAQPAGAAFYQPGPAPPGAPPTGANAV